MKKSVVVLLHLGYWMMYIILILLFLGFIAGVQIQQGKFSFFSAFQFFFSFALFPGVLCFYFFYYVLYPKYLSKRKVLPVICWGILGAVLCAVVGEMMMAILAVIKTGEGIYVNGMSSLLPITILMSFNALANGIIGLIIKGFITSYKDIQLKEDLNKKNYEMELDLIKAQINPHFLFNTINNIDVLIEKEPVKASAYLNKLSDIMRFMLYETKTENILLTKELAYIEKYIDLQKIRTSNPAYVNYSIEGDPAGLTIAPMLFIPFIENAFKHAENKKIENAINIRVNIENDRIIFECANNYSAEMQTKPDQSGLGNELIKKRLMLLYPDKHTLEINDQNNLYRVKLSINQ